MSSEFAIILLIRKVLKKGMPNRKREIEQRMAEGL